MRVNDADLYIIGDCERFNSLHVKNLNWTNSAHKNQFHRLRHMARLNTRCHYFLTDTNIEELKSKVQVNFVGVFNKGGNLQGYCILVHGSTSLRVIEWCVYLDGPVEHTNAHLHHYLQDYGSNLYKKKIIYQVPPDCYEFLDWLLKHTKSKRKRAKGDPKDTVNYHEVID